MKLEVAKEKIFWPKEEKIMRPRPIANNENDIMIVKQWKNCHGKAKPIARNENLDVGNFWKCIVMEVFVSYPFHRF
jgi:hypothetical protein